MQASPNIILTVTNDLTYDQRMHRICTSLANAGYKVTLVGRSLPHSLPLDKTNYQQERITCRNNEGKLFYLEYNWRLFRFLNKLLKAKLQAAEKVALCAIDLDTILPVSRLAKKWKLPPVYDAHELFTELTEVKRRPLVHAVWKMIERTMVPQFQFGYTVNQFIAEELHRRYGVAYSIIRNLPYAATVHLGAGQENNYPGLPPEPFFLYQGAVNEGRSFETLVPAMKMVNGKLVIAGNGNFYQQARQLATDHGMEDKIIFLGYVKPAELQRITPTAYAGITLFENTGLNQYYSLANRYFDYIQAGIPQLCVDYPEYASLNNQFETSLLINDLSPENIAAGLNNLLNNKLLYHHLKQNCSFASKAFCWEIEAEKLVAFWHNVLPIN